MAIKLHVGGLDYGVTDEELNDFFAAEGKVTSAVVIKDKYSGRSKGFGFVEMEDAADGQKAIKELNGKELNGRAITVDEARPPEEHRPRSSGGFGGRSSGGNRGGGRNQRSGDGHRPY